MNFKKIWRFIWNDDSVLSWVLNVIIAVILVKFVIFPGLGLLLGTGFPVVAVVSCSMEQEPSNCWADCYLKGGDLNYCQSRPESICGAITEDATFWEACGDWYENIGIEEARFNTFSESKGFKIGDIFVLRKAEEINVGDIVVYNSGRGSVPIIHRIIAIKDDGDGMYYQTKGDHNKAMLEFEKFIKPEQIHGKVLFKIPYLGWVKLIFNMGFRWL